MLEASIIMPTKNRAPYLEKTLKSLLHLNTPPDQFEILVCDNGSSDDTAKVVEPSFIFMNRPRVLCVPGIVVYPMPEVKFSVSQTMILTIRPTG